MAALAPTDSQASAKPKAPLELGQFSLKSRLTVFNPFKKYRKATDMTTPDNDPQSAHPQAQANASKPQADDSTSSHAFVDARSLPDLPDMAGLAGLAGLAGVDAAAAPAQDSLEQRFAELEAKHTEVADAYLRAKAEAENTRRRADEEVSKARKFAIEAFAESLLPVKDSLEAAIAMPDAKPEQVLEGVHATLRQLSQALERNRVVVISPPAGTKFDPHHHQAISMVPAEQEANSVVAVLQKGYLIADRVLRPALVTVAAPK